ncbi:MAG: hypothetical protein JWQ75_3262, partial [Pseudarthrobacter sp.]|nr:hypothetical protein [Pseudarthrobacter sp.]
RTCSACAADYAALRRAVHAVKVAPDTSTLETPGPHVWEGIHRELGLADSLREDPLAAGPVQDRLPKQAQPRGSAAPLHAVPEPEPEPGQEAASGSPDSAGRRRTAAWWQRPGPWLAAAAATVLVASAGVWLLNRAPEPLAQADLAPLAQYSASGSAKVVRATDGSRTLEVKLSKDEATGYQEVWLIAPDLSKLVSLGVMNSDSGTFTVPAGLELGEYPIVDVSDEPMDGNPAHSSVSIVRGTLSS